MFSIALRLLLLAVLMVPLKGSATVPKMDSIEFDGTATSIWPKGKTWMELPPSKYLDDLQRAERCTAIGGPRGKWSIKNDRLWLIGLTRCGGDIGLESVYGGNGDQIFADWITGEVLIHKGKRLCNEGSSGIGIFEKTIVFTFANGHLMSTQEISNAKHPAIATFDDLRSIFRRYRGGISEALADSYAKEVAEKHQWECLTPSKQRELRD